MNASPQPLPYWRLSGFYFFYFASLGIIVPYWGLYLQWEGFDAKAIGQLTAIMLATRIIAPNVWGWIADHRGQRMQIVQVASLIGVLGFAGIFINQSFWWIAVVMLVFSFFWNATLPQFEVTTLQHLGERSHHYSKIRLWGSIGFILAVLLLGYLLQQFNAGLVPYAIMLSIVGIWLVSLTVPESASRHLSLHHIPLRQLLKTPAIVAFFLLCFLMQASHGPYYTFYSIYLEQNGYSRGHIGLLWAVGVLAEVVVFLWMHRWLPRFGIRFVLLFSLSMSVIRWLLIGFCVQHWPVIALAQGLHALSFGAFHAAAIAWVHQHFVGRNQGRGQALYSSVSFGAGGALGSLISGYWWVTPGPSGTFLLAACTAGLAWVIGFRWLNSNERSDKTPKNQGLRH